MKTASYIPPKQKLLDVSRVIGAAYNPKNRTDKKNLKALMASIIELGLIYPIVVDPENVVIDGHRRLAVARELGWETIPAIILDRPPDRVYASVNVTSRKMGGNDALSVWLVRPGAVDARQASQFREMQEVLGRNLVEAVRDKGYSWRVYRTARQITRYCDDESNKTIQAVVRWLLEFALIGQVMKAIEAGEPAKLLMEAVKSRKPIKMRLTVSD